MRRPAEGAPRRPTLPPRVRACVTYGGNVAARRPRVGLLPGQRGGSMFIVPPLLPRRAACTRTGARVPSALLDVLCMAEQVRRGVGGVRWAVCGGDTPSCSGSLTVSPPP